MKWQKELNLAKQAAISAGDRLTNFGRNEVIDRSGRDVKHRADLESEKIILDILRSESTYAVLTEESGELGIINKDSPIWIVDPLDGTLNFSQNIQFSCISIALWQEKQPILGVVFDFTHDELFSGIVGFGAWCNQNPIKISGIDLPNSAVLATGFPINRDFSYKGLNTFLQQINQFKKIRLLGSAALSMAYVACGRIDAYTEEDIMFWDVAAGIVLVKAAGGTVFFQNSTNNKWAKNVWAGEVYRETKEKST